MHKQIILCVDDENIILQSIKSELFSLFGGEFIIETAETGPEALEIFKEALNNHCQIPVVISDYIMPGMKGDELLKQVHRISPESKTIMLTGQAHIEGITNAINHANLFHYLEKPWKKESLKEVVSKAVAHYRQNCALAAEHLNLSQVMDELKAKIQEKSLELQDLQARLHPEGSPEMAGQLSKNLLLFDEIKGSLARIKARMDLLAEQPEPEGPGGAPLSRRLEEEFYQSNREEIQRITAFINHLKEGRL